MWILVSNEVVKHCAFYAVILQLCWKNTVYVSIFPLTFLQYPQATGKQKSEKLGTLKQDLETSLVVQCLGLQASTAGSSGSIPGQGARILHAVWCGQK